MNSLTVFFLVSQLAAADNLKLNQQKVENAMQVIEQTIEAAETCDYALRISRDYQQCNEYYELTVVGSEHILAYQLQQIVNAGKMGAKPELSSFGNALYVITTTNLDDIDSKNRDRRFKAVTPKFHAMVTELDLLFFQAREGQLFIYQGQPE